MDEMMMVMMKIRSHETTNNSNNTNTNTNKPNIPITNPTWKLYENPFYISFHHKPQQQIHQEPPTPTPPPTIHKLHLPVSSRKIASSFWDLTFIKPLMESELETARAQIIELRAELDRQRKARKRTESLNKRLSKELSEERKGKEALERVCEELSKEISAGKSEISRVKTEMEEERKMLRTAEIIREERVQMKLADARMVLEEKLSEMRMERKMEKTCFVADVDRGDCKSTTTMQQRNCSEAENPHIRRGIKGFVEFPRVVRAIGCSSSRSSKPLLECQKSQLNMVLKQRGTLRFKGLINIAT